MSFLVGVAIGFCSCFLLVPAALRFGRVFCIYAIVRERQCLVFELFGKVRWTTSEPGLHLPWAHMGPFAALVPFFGRRYEVDLRLDQTYLRSLPVNSEEGAPMGIGVWYEMWVSDPVAYATEMLGAPDADPAQSDEMLRVPSSVVANLLDFANEAMIALVPRCWID